MFRPGNRRTVCRRAESEVVALAEQEAKHGVKHEPVGRDLRVYLNRLSDALFIFARYANKLAGVAEPLWDSRA